MKQTINLLPLKPKAARNWLSFNNFVTIMAVIMISCIASGGYFWGKANAYRQTITQQQSVNQNTQNHLNTLSTQFSQREIPADLENQHLQLQHQIQAMQQMLEITNDSSVDQTSGFSTLVTALNASLPTNAQLNYFKIAEQHALVSLKGSVAQIADMPKLLTNLRVNQLLSNQDISNISALFAGSNYQFELLSTSRENEQ